jgi:hypothetical protein
MSRTARRTLGFDSLEGKVLLSTGLADPAAAVHVAKTKRFLLNGTVYGLPFGSVQQGELLVSTFSLAGNAQSMGNVGGSLKLAHPTITQGKLPDLSNATITLSNSKGSVQLTMAASPSRRYIFVVTGGTGSYASASGSGTAIISFNQKMIEYQIRIRSSLH